MFQSPGLVCQPDCHRAGTPAARHSVMNVMPCTPQSPRRAVSPLTERFGMMLYSISEHHGTFWETHEKMRSAWLNGFVSSPTISRASDFTSLVNTICGGRSDMNSQIGRASCREGADLS